MKSFLTGLKNIALWSYERGSWQYDLLCLLIVATIFLVPSRFFGDRDRPQPMKISARANDGLQFASKQGGFTVYIDEDELRAFLQKRNKNELIGSPQKAIALYLQDRLNRDPIDLRQESYTDPQGKKVYRVRFE